MKKLVPLILLAMLLSACPDAKIPKPPPKVPEPKLAGPLMGAPPLLPRQGDIYGLAFERS